jgi:hypothetical protein
MLHSASESVHIQSHNVDAHKEYKGGQLDRVWD